MSYGSAHGDIAFAVPLFDEFMLRDAELGIECLNPHGDFVGLRGCRFGGRGLAAP